jgi:hypothetical protein
MYHFCEVPGVSNLSAQDIIGVLLAAAQFWNPPLNNATLRRHLNSEAGSTSRPVQSPFSSLRGLWAKGNHRGWSDEQDSPSPAFLELNADFREAWHEYPETMVPQVNLYRAGEGPFAGDAGRIKQTRMLKPSDSPRG